MRCEEECLVSILNNIRRLSVSWEPWQQGECHVCLGTWGFSLALTHTLWNTPRRPEAFSFWVIFSSLLDKMDREELCHQSTTCFHYCGNSQHDRTECLTTKTVILNFKKKKSLGFFFNACHKQDLYSPEIWTLVPEEVLSQKNDWLCLCAWWDVSLSCLDF